MLILDIYFCLASSSSSFCQKCEFASFNPQRSYTHKDIPLARFSLSLRPDMTVKLNKNLHNHLEALKIPRSNDFEAI